MDVYGKMRIKQTSHSGKTEVIKEDKYDYNVE